MANILGVLAITRAKKKARKVVVKVVKRKKAAQSGGYETDGTASSVAPSQRLPEDHYEGGCSQWREDPAYEQQWKHWDWPPRDWRPSKFHASYWDTSSRWHDYNTYNWEQSPVECPPCTSPASRPTLLLSPDSDATKSLASQRSHSSMSLEVDAVTEQLQRCTTGEIMEASFSQRLEEVADKEMVKTEPKAADGEKTDPEKTEKSEPKPADGEKTDPEKIEKTEPKPADGEKTDPEKIEKTEPKPADGEKTDPEKIEKTEHGEKTEPQKIEKTEPKAADGENTEPEKAEPKAAGSDEYVGGADEQLDTDGLSEEQIKRKKAAAARYMRYFWSIRSQGLRIFCVFEIFSLWRIEAKIRPRSCGGWQQRPMGATCTALSKHGVKQCCVRLQGKSLNSVLYDAWGACQGQWTKSAFLQSVRERHRTSRRGIRKWLTASEMDCRFGQDLAEQMRQRKLLDKELKQKETRFHPELPGVEAGACLESACELRSHGNS